jgi:hypothetical protein
MVMINKDKVERGAVAAQEGWGYLLCQFHVTKIWSSHITKACCNDTRGTNSI